MRVRFVKELKAEEKIREFEEKYGTVENLEAYLRRRPEDVLAQIDLKDWRYLLEHPGARVVEGEVRVSTGALLTKNELQILSAIKKEQPDSIRIRTNSG